MHNKIFLAATIAAFALGAQVAHAQTKPAPAKAPDMSPKAPAGPDKPTTANNLALCIGCHGIPGYKTAYPMVYHVPMIAGQQPAYIVNALKAYKSGERSHPSMRGIAASLTDKDMEALAAYYAGPAK
jgi:cytochrome c553